jgi:hypothetical protein
MAVSDKFLGSMVSAAILTPVCILTHTGIYNSYAVDQSYPSMLLPSVPLNSFLFRIYGPSLFPFTAKSTLPQVRPPRHFSFQLCRTLRVSRLTRLLFCNGSGCHSNSRQAPNGTSCSSRETCPRPFSRATGWRPRTSSRSASP